VDFFLVEVSAELSACAVSDEPAVLFLDIEDFFFVEVSAELSACAVSAESASLFLDLLDFFFFVEVSVELSAD
jgi:hypothetical protein